MFSGESTNTNFIVFGLTQPRLEPWSTALEASTLAITSPMRFISKDDKNVEDIEYIIHADDQNVKRRWRTDKHLGMATDHMTQMSYRRPSWSWSYGSWNYSYLCNQCLSPLMLWVRISIRAWCTMLCDKVCQWLATGRWFSLGPNVSSTNKIDRHDITEILLKLALTS